MKLISLAILGALLVSMGSYAGDSDPVDKSQKMKSEVAFSKLDENKDGQLTPTEAARDAKLAQRWSNADLDRSGRVSQEEFILFFQEAPAAGKKEQ